MKRFFCFLFVLVLMPVISLADLPDISNLSLDELIQLNKLVNDYLFEKTLPDGVLLPSGSYVVGVDIPAGEYRADVVSNVGGSVRIYETKADSKRAYGYSSEILLGKMYGTLVFRLVLEEGNYIIVDYNSLKLYPYLGLIDMSIPKND